LPLLSRQGKLLSRQGKMAAARSRICVQVIRRGLTISAETPQHKSKIKEQFSLQAEGFSEFKYHNTEEAMEVFQTLGRFTKQCKVLDSGCGPGLVSIYMSRYVKECVALDLTERMLTTARKNVARESVQNITFVQGDMTKLPFSDSSFDGCLTRYTFHHLQHPAAALRELVRVTRPGGRIVVVDATPLPAKQESYNRFERLRDPSHTTALTTEELVGLGNDLPGAELLATTKLGLTVDAQDLIDKAFPESISRKDLMELLRCDVGKNELDFNVTLDPETTKLLMTFPKSAVVWLKKP